MEDVRTLYLSLPADIRAWISSDRELFIRGVVAKRHALSQDQYAALSRLDLELCAGKVPPHEFADGLASALAVERKVASVIANDVREEILRPIYQQLLANGVDIDAMRPQLGV